MGRVLAAVAAAAVVLLLVPWTAGALVEQPFAPRYTANEPGAIWVTGNTLMTCPAAAGTCAAGQSGTATGAALNNNGYAMVPVDVDGDPATFNSFNSTFAPPGIDRVLFAGLYFGSRTTAGAGGAPAPDPGGAAACCCARPRPAGPTCP